MQDRDAKLLFEYLGSILYESDPVPPAEDEISPGARELLGGLSCLSTYVKELTAYSHALATGDLDAPLPDRENPLCYNLKQLHSVLNHLTFQVHQVAAGDYSQRVSSLRAFSDSFNKMIAQLREREQLLRQESENAQRNAAMFRGYHDILLSLAETRDEIILISDVKSQRRLYCNKQAEGRSCNDCSFHDPSLLAQLHTGAEDGPVREIETEGAVYRVTSFRINWEGVPAWADIVQNVTSAREQERMLSDIAYRDALTGLFNRRYFLSGLAEAIDEERPFSLCSMDMDGLKYVNDTLGHAAGDEYINGVVRLISASLRRDDLFARMGGDEFSVLFYGCGAEVAERKMEGLHNRIASKALSEHGTGGGLSYGVVAFQPGMTPESMLEAADAAMYACKRRHREQPGYRSNR